MKLNDLSIPISRAKKKFSTLKSQYPTLHAKLVLCNKHGHVDIDASGNDILQSAATIFVDSKEAKELRIIHSLHLDLSRRNQTTHSEYISTLLQSILDRIHNLLSVVELVDSTQIELRFDQLDYELIDELRRNPMVDQRLTPQTRASIQIVLGDLYSLSKEKDQSGGRSDAR